MAYLDTNIIVSYCFKDENHAKAAKIIEELRRERKQLRISPLTLTELFAVASAKGDSNCHPTSNGSIGGRGSTSWSSTRSKP
jgi:predicted nucleic acid-binding protein